MSGGPVETLPTSPDQFSRHHIHRSPLMSSSSPSSSSRDSRPKLCLPLNSRAICKPPSSLEDRVRSISPDELARRLTRTSSSNGKNLSYLLLDARGLLCFTQSHIQGAVHIACSDRFNRKRVANCSSVLDLVSTWATSGSSSSSSGWRRKNKWREVVVYDEGTNDLGSILGSPSGWQTSPLSFVLIHLLQENRQPLYLKGGFKEFSRLHPDLTESSVSLAIPSQRSKESGVNFSPLATSPLTSVSSGAMTSSLETEPPTQVLPFLWVGNARDSGDSQLLSSLGIRYVLSLTTHPPPVIALAFQSASSSGSNATNKLRTKWIPVSDNLTENLAPHFEDACQFIEEARSEGANILIHCQAGISRSPTIAIAYIMKHADLSTLEAYAVVQRCRRIISPNLNFMGQLVEFETKLKNSNSSSSSSSSSCSSETMEDSL